MWTILLVDDNASARTATAKFLQQAGYEVICAGGAEAALALLEQKPIDLVLLDLMMPRMDGFELLQLLRTDPRFDHVPAIVFTALRDGLSFRRARQLGADKYLLKGQVTPADLLRHIQRLLPVHGAQDSPTGSVQITPTPLGAMVR